LIAEWAEASDISEKAVMCDARTPPCLEVFIQPELVPKEHAASIKASNNKIIFFLAVSPFVINVLSAKSSNKKSAPLQWMTHFLPITNHFYGAGVA
jgi:hypothetical protein